MRRRLAIWGGDENRTPSTSAHAGSTPSTPHCCHRRGPPKHLISPNGDTRPANGSGDLTEKNGSARAGGGGHRPDPPPPLPTEWPLCARGRTATRAQCKRRQGGTQWEKRQPRERRSVCLSLSFFSPLVKYGRYPLRLRLAALSIRPPYGCRGANVCTRGSRVASARVLPVRVGRRQWVARPRQPVAGRLPRPSHRTRRSPDQPTSRQRRSPCLGLPLAPPLRGRRGGCCLFPPLGYPTEALPSSTRPPRVSSPPTL